MADGHGLRLAGVVALALALSSAPVACSGNGSEARSTSAPTGSTAPDCHPTAGGPAQGSAPTGAAASSIKLQPGPAITPEEAAAEAPARRGTPLFLTGSVYAGDCRTPLEGAVIEVWQTDARGVYGPGHGTNHLRCCYLQGTVETDGSGRYSIETIRPGHYRGEKPPPPAHIHFNVHHPGTLGVMTEVVFAGDPHVEDAESGAEVIRLRTESSSGGRVLRGRFDIVLATTSG